MTVEWLKNIEFKEQTSEELKTNIDNSINDLNNIDPNNELIQKLSDITDKLKDNKEALKIINEWLNKINDKVNSINQEWLEKIKGILKNIINKIESSESTIPDLDKKLEEQLNNS